MAIFKNKKELIEIYSMLLDCREELRTVKRETVKSVSKAYLLQ